MGNIIQVATAAKSTGDYQGHYVYALDADGKLWRAFVCTWTRGTMGAPKTKWKLVDWEVTNG